MSEKPEQYYEHSSHYLALSAAAQFIQMTAGTLDTYSPLAKAEILAIMGQLIDRVIEAQAESSELKRPTQSERTNDNGEI